MAFRVDPDGIVADVDVDVDPALAAIRGLVAQGHEAGAQFGKNLSAGSIAGFKKLEDNIHRIANLGAKTGAPLAKSMKNASASTLQLVEALQRVNEASSVIVAGLQQVTQSFVRESKERVNAETQATNTGLREARNANAQEVVLIQQQTAAAKSAASARLQAGRFLYESLGRLEKGFGSVVSGVARTVTSGFSKSLSAVGTLFHRSNTQMTEGFSSSLSKRESILRSSFSRQDKLVSESVSRETRRLTELRTATQSGVLGAASRAGLFGGLALGFAGIAAAKSTFTIGADFTRGLAVLQAQLDLTAVQMKSVRQLSIDLGNDITLPGVSALDAAQAIQILTKQFGSLGPAAVDAAEAAAKGTLQLSRAAGVTAEEAAGIIGAAVNVFQIGADKAVSIADQITGTLAKAAGVSFEDFQTSFVQGATVFEQFVGPVEDANDVLLDFNTTLAVLAKNGITGSNAGAGLKQFFLQATKQSDKALTASATLAKRAGESGNIFFDAQHNARRYDDSLRILRKGLEGYSDEQRNATLATLFGSRSITIASALINTSQADYDKLRGSIQKQGLAAKIAAAQNTGLKGALDALKSVVETVQILIFEKFNKGLGNAVLAFTNFTNALLFGNGVFATVRTALLGAGTAIGGLLAIRVASELFSVFTATVSLMLTPFGALVAIFGVLGAVTALLAKDFPQVSAVFDNLKDSIAKLTAGPLASVKGLLSDVIGFFTEPTTAAAAAEGGGNMVRSLNGGIEHELNTKSPFGNFVQDRVIPAFHTAIAFIQEQVIPQFLRIAQVAKDTFATVETAVLGFFHRVQPVLQPAIDGFKDLVRALGPSGLASIAAGLAGFAVGGPLVGAALAGITLIGTRLAGVFGGDASAVGAGARSAASGLGAVLGNLASTVKDKLAPIGTAVGDFLGGIFTGANLSKFESGFLKVVERVGFLLGNLISNPKVVAAAGLIATGAVVIGFRFVEGFAKGVVDNIPALFHGAAALIGKALFDPKIILPIIIGAFAFTKVIQPLLANFRSIGASSGQAFGKGLRGAIPAGKGFLSTLFGGAGSAGGVTAGIDRELQSITNRMRVLGKPNAFFSSDRSGLSQARVQLRQLENSFTAAEKRGLEMRDSLQRGFRTAQIFGTGTSGVLGGIKQIGAAFINVGRSAVSSLTAAFRNITNVKHGDERALSGLQALGVQSGKQYGDGFASSLRGGLSQIGTSIKTAFQGFAASARQAGQVLGQTLASSALAAFGGFTAGKAEGSSGGSGLLSALGLGLTAGLATGNVAIGALAGGAALLGAAFGRAGKKADEARERISQFTDALKGELKTAIEDGVIKLDQLNKGLSLSDVSGFDSVQDAFDGLSDSSKHLLAGLGVNFKRDLEPILKRSSSSVNDLKLAVLDAAKASGTFTKSVKIPDLLGGGADTILTVTDQYAAFFQFVLKGFDGLTPAQQEFLNSDDAKGLRDSLAGLGTVYDELQTGLGKLNDEQKLFGDLGTIDNKRTQYDALAESLGLSAGAFGRLNAEQAKGADTSAVQDVINDLSDATSAADTATTAIDRLLNPTSAGTVASAILSLKGTFEGLQLNGDIFNNASFTAGLDKVRSEFKDVVDAGIQQGTIFNDTTLKNITDPLLDAVLAGVADPAVRAAITAQFTGLQVSVKPKLTGDLANITDSVSRQQALKLPISVDASGAKLDMADADKQRFIANLRGVGIDAMHGLARGITFGGVDVETAMDAVANHVVIQAKQSLKISSPSKVFTDIGTQIGAGLAKGIADSETDITSAVSSALDGAVTAAQSGGGRLVDALKDATGQLFDKLTGTDALVKGPGSSFDLTSAVAAITNARQSLLSGFDSNAQRLFDVNKRGTDPKADPLNNADKAIFGSDLFSLDVKDFFGASNISNFSSALDDIAALGKTLLAQGRPAQEVADTLKGYVADLVATGTSLGFNQDQLLALVDTLGLSNDALAGFVQQVSDLGAAAVLPAATLTPAELTALNRPVVNQTIYLPTVDTHAAALSVANATALASYVPGG